MHWYIKVLKQYFDFSGRARRKEYWLFALINLLISLGFSIIDGITGTMDSDTGYGLLSGLYALAVFIPTLAVAVRRLHDTSRSGWWLLILFVPLIGLIVLLVFLCQSSHPDNAYGEAPNLES